ncbi:MAG: histidine phosphatase family protein [Chitinophagales bacterium]|nr:histidine phosphatase family protein [Chitinophagales bacterium]
MKTIVLVRHAKSSWKDNSADDHDRTLNKRGEHDAPFMAKVFKDKNIDPEILISSSAVRAFATAKEFAKILGYKKRKILKSTGLYLAELEEWISFIKEMSEKYSRVVLFGHNPGITQLANYFSGESIDNMPTCSFCVIEFNLDKWDEADEKKGTLKFFEYPKKYFPELEE